MMLLYAVLPAPAIEVDGLESYAGDTVSVLYEPRDQAPERTFGEVLRFGKQIHLLSRAGPLLPIRFGTLLNDHEELRRLVAEHESVWSERLRHVAGHCELIVHLDLPRQRTGAEGAAPYASGADYLRRRAADAHARKSVVDGLLARVQQRVKEHRALPPMQEDRLALLVPEQDAGAVRVAVEQWATGTGETVKVSGPWPPFSFCEEEVGS